MPTITANKEQHRFDSPVLPIYFFGEMGTYPKIFIRDHLYRDADKPYFIWNPPNRTEDVLVELRSLSLHTWTLSSGVANVSGNFTKSAAAGFSGAAGAEVSGNCSIEGKSGNAAASIAFALQSGTFSYDYVTTGDVEHALVFNQGFDGVIREKGEVKKRFRWGTGDSGMVERKGNIVRYYLIKNSGELILLRAKRAMLADPVTPTVILYQSGAKADAVRIWNNSSAEAPLQLFGVLENFQDWRNSAKWDSLAEKTTGKDRTEDFTYFSDVKSLMSLSVNVEWDEGDEYRKFLEFWKYHDVSKEFFFVDNARHFEFFARFTSGFSDSPQGADTFGMSADISQIVDPPEYYQTDVPYELPDTIAPDTPSAPVLSLSTSRTIIVDGDVPLDNDDYFYYYV